MRNNTMKATSAVLRHTQSILSAALEFGSVPSCEGIPRAKGSRCLRCDTIRRLEGHGLLTKVEEHTYILTLRGIDAAKLTQPKEHTP